MDTYHEAVGLYNECFEECCKLADRKQVIEYRMAKLQNQIEQHKAERDQLLRDLAEALHTFDAPTVLYHAEVSISDKLKELGGCATKRPSPCLMPLSRMRQRRDSRRQLQLNLIPRLRQSAVQTLVHIR